MMRMLDVEIRRCFARRLVRLLIAVAIVGCLIAGIIARREAGPVGSADEFRLIDLWIRGGDSLLGIAGIFLVIGAVIGGASMIGAEWRSGTLVTLLTWEPSRVRVATSKLLACAIVAAGIAFALQILWCLAFLPAALGPGTTTGADTEWLRSLAAAGLRLSVLAGLTAVLMASIAMIGRNTAAALGAAFAYMIIFENIARAWKPWSARFLLGQNGAIFASDADLRTEAFTRSTEAAGLTLAAYALAVALVAVTLFWRRDLASAS